MTVLEWLPGINHGSATHGHMTVTQVLGNRLAFTTSCQAPSHDHVIAICNLHCWIPQKLNEEGCKQRGH